MFIVAILMVGLMLINMSVTHISFTNYALDSREQFEERRLDLMSNNGTDAAALQLRLQTGDLNLDYKNEGAFEVDPLIAKTAFGQVMSSAYDLTDNENRDYFVRNYVPLFMVCAYDGYFTLENGPEDKVYFSQKYPYTYKKNNDTYLLNLGYNKYDTLKPSGELIRSDDDIDDDDEDNDESSNVSLTYNEEKEAVNNLISDTLNIKLQHIEGLNQKGKFYIPYALTSITAANPVEQTTVFAYVKDFDLGVYSKKLKSFSIGGSKLKLNNPVVGFKWFNNGREELGYCYFDDLPKDINIFDKVSFDNPKEAAENGFYYFIKED